jgi:hypothetical protein
VNSTGPDQRDTTHWYEIRLQGRLAPRWSTWLADMTVSHDPDGSTVLRAPAVDQAALHGLLARVRDIGMPLLSIIRLDDEPIRPIAPSALPAPSDPPKGDRP